MEISFTDMVKLVHPDSNPDIVDASEKMSVVVRNRRNKRALWNLAVRWGLVQGVENQNVTIQGDVSIHVSTEVSPWDTGQRPVRQEPPPIITRAQYEEFQRQMLEQRMERQRQMDEFMAQQYGQILKEDEDRHSVSAWQIPEPLTPVSEPEPQPQPEPEPQEPVSPWTTGEPQRPSNGWSRPQPQSPRRRRWWQDIF